MKIFKLFSVAALCAAALLGLSSVLSTAQEVGGGTEAESKPLSQTDKFLFDVRPRYKVGDVFTQVETTNMDVTSMATAPNGEVVHESSESGVEVKIDEVRVLAVDEDGLATQYRRWFALSYEEKETTDGESEEEPTTQGMVLVYTKDVESGEWSIETAEGHDPLYPDHAQSELEKWQKRTDHELDDLKWPNTSIRLGDTWDLSEMMSDAFSDNEEGPEFRDPQVEMTFTGILSIEGSPNYWLTASGSMTMVISPEIQLPIELGMEVLVDVDNARISGGESSFQGAQEQTFDNGVVFEMSLVAIGDITHYYQPADEVMAELGWDE